MSSDKWQEPETTEGPLPNRYLRLSLIFVSVVAVGLLAAWVFGDDSAPPVATIGETAPAFEVRNVEGDEPLALADLINDDDQPIVINLMASWCGPCRAEIPEISAFADANPGVVVVGVAVEDNYDDFMEFVSEVGPTYTVGFDDGEMRAAYQTLGLPATFFLDSSGIVVSVYNGILDQDVLEQQVSGIN